MVILLAFMSLGLQEQAKPLVPDKATRDAITAEIHNLFKDEYSKRDPESRKAFAAKLLSYALKTEDADQRFVMLVEVRDVAAAAGDIKTAFYVINRIVAGYDTAAAAPEWSAPAQKIAALDAGRNVARPPKTASAIASAYLRLAHEAMQIDDYEAAINAANGAIRTSRDQALTKEARDLARKITTHRKEAEKVAAAELKLTINPDDPDANLMIGRFNCFVKDDWEKGLPFLARGSDSGLKTVAEKELAKPEDRTGRTELGDAWYDLSKKEPDQTTKGCYQDRARKWYLRALEGATGLSRLSLEKKIGAMPVTRGMSQFGLGEILTGRWWLSIDDGPQVHGVMFNPDGTGTMKCLRHPNRLRRKASTTFRWKVESGKLQLIPDSSKKPWHVYSASLPLNPEGSRITYEQGGTGKLVKVKAKDR